MNPLDPNAPRKHLPVPVTASTPPPVGDSQLLPASLFYSAFGQASADPAPGLSSAPTVAGLTQALRRRWPLAFGLATAAAVGVLVAVIVFLPPRYVAEARFAVSAVVEVPVVDRDSAVHDEFAIVKERQKALFKSRFVLARALDEKVSGGRSARELGIVRNAKDPIAWLETALKNDFKVAPEIMSAWLTADDADEAAEMLNAVAEAYIKENRQKDDARRNERLERYREKLGEEERQLGDMRKNLVTKLQQDTKAKAREAAEREYKGIELDLSAWRVQLIQVASKRGDAQFALADYEAKLLRAPEARVPDDKVDEYLRADRGAEAYYKQIEEAQGAIALLQAGGNPDFVAPKIAAEKGKMKSAETQLEQYRKQFEPKLAARYRAFLKADLTEKIDAGKQQLTSLARQEKEVAKHVQDLNSRMADLEKGQLVEPLDIVNLKTRIAGTQSYVDEMRKRIGLMSAESPAPRVSLQQAAAPPSDKDYSRQIKVGGAGAMAIFGLVLFGVGYVEFRSRRISGADDVSRGLGLNVVGTLPNLPARVRASKPTAARDLALVNQMHESVDAIRTMLLHAARTEPLRVIMVTSANGGEGKTSLASQLAVSLSRAWRKTLLIDGDLRNPATHKLFEVPAEPGLCEVLRGEVAVGDAIRATPHSRLWLLPAGNWDAHAIQALAQDNVADLLGQLKDQYDFVIVDASPVLPVADALQIGRHVDGVIFAILRDVSRAPEVMAAHQRLAPLGIRTLGAVVIGTPDDLGSRGRRYSQAGA